MWLVAIVLSVVIFLPSPATALTLIDMGGRPLTLPALPQRIVSLVPSATELIFALGGEARLVGVTDYCDFPPAARQKPSVGSMLAPSLETIVTLRPDLVIATDAGNRQETFAQLQRLGIAVYLVHATSVSQMLDVAARLGLLTEQPAAVVRLTGQLRRRIQAVEKAVAPYPRPRVLYVLWPDPLIVPGRGALVSELIRLAGGDSITADEATDYPRFSLEAAVARAPDIIILARHSGQSEPLPRERWDRLATLPAVKAGRVHAVDGGLLHRYGPRVVDGLEMLARLIHPEAFR